MDALRRQPHHERRVVAVRQVFLKGGPFFFDERLLFEWIHVTFRFMENVGF